MYSESQDPKDILDQYPELQRARNLYIELFKDRSALVSLGYQGFKLDRTVATLKLISEPGKIQTFAKLPFLEFENPPNSGDDKYDDYIQIGEIWGKGRDRNGYSLSAQHKQFGDMPLDTSSNVAAEASSVVNEISKELGLDHERAVDIYLLKEGADLTSLDLLARLTLTHGRSEDKFLQENFVTRVFRKAGEISTYEAVWVDDKKDAFLVKEIQPQFTKSYTEESSTHYSSYKILKPIKDDRGQVTPVGQRWIPEGTIKRMFAERRSVAVQGRLVLTPVRA